MVIVEGLDFGKVFEGFRAFAHAVVAEGEHVLAVDDVLRVEGVLPDEQVGQRDGEVVHDLMLEDVLLAVVDETVEASVGLTSTPQLVKGQSLIEDLVGLGIVVVHGCGGFLWAFCRLLPVCDGFLLLPKGLVGYAEEVVEVILLSSLTSLEKKSPGLLSLYQLLKNILQL